MKINIANGVLFQLKLTGHDKICFDANNTRISNSTFELNSNNCSDYYFEMIDIMPYSDIKVDIYKVETNKRIFKDADMSSETFEMACKDEIKNLEVLDYDIRKSKETTVSKTTDDFECSCEHSFFNSYEGCTCGAFKREQEAKTSGDLKIDKNEGFVFKRTFLPGIYIQPIIPVSKGFCYINKKVDQKQLDLLRKQFIDSPNSDYFDALRYIIYGCKDKNLLEGDGDE